MYCWNLTYNDKDPIIETKFFNFFSKDQTVKEIAASSNHTLYLLDDGSVFMSNEFEEARKIPELVKGIETETIIQIAVGHSFSAALNNHGKVFVWGTLGKDIEFTEPSVIMKADNGTKIVKIATGENFILMLADDGRVYSMGRNRYGQLGIGNNSSHSKPVQIERLEGIPITNIACGESHSIAVSASGFVFSFGRNNSGQLGHDNNKSRYYPVKISQLDGSKACYASCGKNFIAILTVDGYYFAFGCKPGYPYSDVSKKMRVPYPLNYTEITQVILFELSLKKK